MMLFRRCLKFTGSKWNTHNLLFSGAIYSAQSEVNCTLGRRTYVTQGSNQRKRYNVGLFGCGRIAGVHLKNILSNRRLDLKWIVENDMRRIQEVKDEFYLDGNTPFFPSSERDRLLSDKSLDAVVVVSPTSTHTEYIVQSLKHGKDVFTEKPAGESVSDIRLCYETAENTGRTFLTGFTRRFDDSYRDVKSAIDNGTLGKLQVIKTTTRDSPKPSYEFLKSIGQSDVTSFHFRLDILMSTLNDNKGVYLIMMRTMNVFGTGGMALAENPREISTVIDGESGGSTRRLFNSFPQRFEAPFAAELDHFINCMDGTTTPLVTKEESLCVADIIEKGVQSYREKRVVFF
ncbi:myo-inositol 2-dehydrogenase-like [Mya arenaria]|uniref:myo-inositol 2-dehydrogenase-like n=1 Tax=Mya arenaria TaxID=6604 RepID=UPI0022DF4C97|nr:myo-inositol 2-dehydrogenase-like [Mya arenaria]